MNVIHRGVIVGAIGALSLVVGGLGIATAANGGAFRLGASNHATRTTTLTDHHGTALALVGKTSRPPLTVNSSKQVKHLNASLVGGKSASTLETAGSAAQFRHSGNNLFTGLPLGVGQSNLTEVAETAPLKPGVYYVHASAETVYDGNGASTDDIFCRIASSAAPAIELATAANTTTGYATESEDTVITLTQPEAVGEFCDSQKIDAAFFEGGIYATRVEHSVTGTAPSG